ncbi:monovalent cation/H+ antiporter subunit D [Maribrevibacterium harenarium]|uniref:Monovalent cation/H+ antiporter subunit D n=1 Tax=Maribrevibacterium harenarium TaxID=2589817 RepID=A0A501WAJ0_9GAMM|nr:monovalent cation/H+ antiporter subunit D [Maribrevibacterium harenarium]TPE46649.1 monovalent cation/H+ antiporter subunit D [Maribrevibacterium harenarium]
MQHLPILPVLIPLLAGALLLLPPFSSSLGRQRSFTLAVAILLVAVSILLTTQVNQFGVYQYVLGNWQPPFGIVLVADPFSTLMVTVTAILGCAALIYGSAGLDKTGGYFYPLFMFQIMGVNGAFLTGDIFNLFVFFEVLLIASYALLVHGGGKHKTQATVHYVIINLVGSSVFLFGLGIIYGTLGTLNIADLANKVSQLQGADATLAKIGALLLLVVFGLKSAMLPLHFWLPKAYSSASAPVAAIFAIMTKVGIYSILRIHHVIFGEHAGELMNLAQHWLWPFAVMTVVIGTIGALASPSLRLLSANLVVLSAGTLLIAAALQSTQATAAAIYYMIHSTFVAGALFLIADVVATQRGKAEDRFVRARAMSNPIFLGMTFATAAIAVIGMPPLSGFIGKIMLLQAAHSVAEIAWVWPTLLISSLGALIALSRAGTTLFWRHSGSANGDAPALHIGQSIAIVILLSMSVAMSLWGGLFTELATSAASFLHDPTQSVKALLPEVQ